MKIEFCKTVEVESVIDIGVDDITSALYDSLASAVEAAGHEASSDDCKVRRLLHFINSAYQCLSSVTVDMIDLLPESPRKIIAQRFREQADRYSAMDDMQIGERKT